MSVVTMIMDSSVCQAPWIGKVTPIHVSATPEISHHPNLRSLRSPTSDIFTVVPPLPDRKVAEEVILGCYHTMVLAKDMGHRVSSSNMPNVVEASQLGLGLVDVFGFTGNE